MTLKNYTIYKISCKDPNVKDVYIGSTTHLKSRLTTHKTTIVNPNNPHSKFKLYNVMRENGGWDNWKVDVLEELNNVAKIDARKREEEWSKQLNATLNTWKAYRNLDEAKNYYEKGSEWYKKNHERSTLRYKKMCEKIANLEKENAELKAKLESIKNLI
jgi:hypothetical protein